MNYVWGWELSLNPAWEDHDQPHNVCVTQTHRPLTSPPSASCNIELKAFLSHPPRPTCAMDLSPDLADHKPVLRSSGPSPRPADPKLGRPQVTSSPGPRYRHNVLLNSR
ncbi:hypothetical protein E2C01_031835 [Portunus trituberculatus]|uniref:Uncharacterized protein n=1 Tax=Portunus trituberculatus TaxID=210409 RepID=A0A5B7ETV2_PORTR|nr:hypothetical protein [Portunus trituberculatus]